MIRSNKQLAVARQKLEKVEEALQGSTAEVDRQVWVSLAKELRCEIDEYRAIKSGQTTVFQVSSLDDVGEALIKARMACGLTQKQLADRLGVSEQMVQKDEAGGYESASVARLADVADALDYQLTGNLQPAGLKTQVTVVNAPTMTYGTPPAAENRVLRAAVDLHEMQGTR
ncbi:helix-turn-helix domain-containing protein [Streptomyces sp. IB201691-2A2]|uniref:helix-turn-helix domain-containing protein n=1 Tax=Streptomyces sp. IB201691-2A2 TaxID=2561920 RepID=UPI00117D7832|nr:helix-turn-helix transcriptional regulator [Streptomyces sp. IB201691-2A2]TRO64777.1 XRE family transcriptional regulator [Streptomyces sp. IB201691-2A2]